MMNQAMRMVLVIGVIVIAALLVLALLGGAGMMGGYGPGMMGRWSYRLGGWAGLPILFAVLIVAGLGLVGVWALQEGRHRPPTAGRRPLDILKERYARGELTREQFEQMRRELE